MSAMPCSARWWATIPRTRARLLLLAVMTVMVAVMAVLRLCLRSRHEGERRDHGGAREQTCLSHVPSLFKHGCSPPGTPVATYDTA
jgi:hypothetical protein